MARAIPTDLDWIQIGLKVQHKDWNGLFTIISRPYWDEDFLEWRCRVKERNLAQACKRLIKPEANLTTADERLARIVGMVEGNERLDDIISTTQRYGHNVANLVRFDHVKALEEVVELINQIKAIAKGEVNESA